VALLSDDATKLKALGRKYGVKRLYAQSQLAECLADGVDVLYVATPNDTHAGIIGEAVKQGVHVLCEKPLANTYEEAEEVVRVAAEEGVKLMTAYRLHFEAANLAAIEAARNGDIGEPLIFNSVFTMKVDDPGNIRLHPISEGGGTLHDIGIYCINAARYLFGDEPEEVFAMSVPGRSLTKNIDEVTGAMLRFPKGRIATFVTSFDAGHSADYDLIGTTGRLRLESAYEYACPMKLTIKKGEKTRTRRYPQRDQFAPELIYFSDCLLHGRGPEPSGKEGLADLAVIEALLVSARTGQPVKIDAVRKGTRPSLKQLITRPKVRKTRLVRVSAPTR
jgi:glucose-fructose oxidoreductase